MSAQPQQSTRLSAEGQATLARLSASVEAALACLMDYEAQQAADVSAPQVVPARREHENKTKATTS